MSRLIAMSSKQESGNELRGTGNREQGSGIRKRVEGCGLPVSSIGPEAAHPSDKNKNVARVGHPPFWYLTWVGHSGFWHPKRVGHPGFWRLAGFLLVAVLAVPAGARTRPHYGGTLRVEIEGDPWQQYNGVARRLVLDGLTVQSADGTALPALALEWKAENDFHRWQFKLRPGVRFHDGSALTAPVAIDALNGVCGAKCPWTAIHAVGSSLVFTGDAPMPNLSEMLASDKYLIEIPDASGAGKVIGTGPFQLAAFNRDLHTLVANENGWQGRPYVDKIEIYPRKSIHDQWLDLSVGHADLVEVPAEQMRQAHEQRLTVSSSAPATLLALTVSPKSGVLGNPDLRAAIAPAVDRSALYNVIFQKQGEVTASLLPAALSGYSFLFSADRDLNKSHKKRGGLTAPGLILAAESGNTMQLAAQRIALNLHEAGFTVQVVGAERIPWADMVLRRLPLESTAPRAALEAMLRNGGRLGPVVEDSPAGLYRVERDFLESHMLIPLLYLPRAWAAGGRVRDLRLSPDGTPLLAEVSLEDAP